MGAIDDFINATVFISKSAACAAKLRRAGRPMPAGRPRIHDGPANARRAANARAADRARANGIVQRSVTLPAACWSIVRAARGVDDTSDAQTLARLLQAATGGVPASTTR